MTDPNKTTIWARAFMDELARAGVREVCVAPGSRSTPLVLATAGDPRFTLHAILDERAAGFFALGLGKASRRPAAVITTSGTAGANVYPAVVEASQGDVPLLVLTADRPHRLRDTDGNQAMDQLRLFGTFPRGFFEVAPAEAAEEALRHLRGQADRAVALALGPPPGPVHLNFPFAKPLEPPCREPTPGRTAPSEAPGSEGGPGRGDTEAYLRIVPPVLEPPWSEVEGLGKAMAGARRGVVVAGPVSDPDSVGGAVLALAAGTGFPVLADPLSGARFRPSGGAFVVGGYDLFLRSSVARRLLAPDLILRVGASPTSAAALNYLDDHREAPQIVVDDGHRWKDHLASAHTYLRATPGPLLRRLASECPEAAPEASWRSQWQGLEARTLGALEGLSDGELLEGEILAGVVGGVPEGTNLLVASSMPIRDLDAFAFPDQKRLNVFGNRGVSGIDGLISTAVGISAGRGREPENVPTVAVLGDLAFLHDLNGLNILRAVNSWTLLVVVNNDGGGIFHTLPVREYEPHFTPYFATPHGLDLQKAGELFRLPYTRVDTRDAFRTTFPEVLERGGPAILEVRTRRKETHARRRELIRSVVTIMDELRPPSALYPEDEKR